MTSSYDFGKTLFSLSLIVVKLNLPFEPFVSVQVSGIYTFMLCSHHHQPSLEWFPFFQTETLSPLDTIPHYPTPNPWQSPLPL